MNNPLPHETHTQSQHHVRVVSLIWLCVWTLVGGYAGIGIIFFYSHHMLKSSLEKLHVDYLPRLILTNDAKNYFQNTLHYFQDSVTLGDLESFEKGKKELSKAILTIKRLCSLGEEESNTEYHYLFQQLSVYEQEALSLYEQMIQQKFTDISESIMEKNNKIFTMSKKIESDLITLGQTKEEEVSVFVNQASYISRIWLWIHLGLFIMIVLCVFVLVYIILHRYLIFPLREIVAFAHYFGKGNLSRRIPIHRLDEFGIVSSALNSMAERLSETIRDLEHYQTHLEELVKERTQALEEDMKKRMQLEVRFKAAFHANPAAMVITRFTDGLFLEVNEAFVKLFGYTPEELQGKTSLDIGIYPSPELRERLKNEISPCSCVIFPHVQLYNKKKELIDVFLASQQLIIEQEPFLLTVLLDITREKQMERELTKVQKQLLQTAHLAGKAEISAEILHNIGNLLNSTGITIGQIKYVLQQLSPQYLILGVQKLRNIPQIDTKLATFFEKLGNHFQSHYQELQEHFQRMTYLTEELLNIVTLYQTQHVSVSFKEDLNLNEIIEGVIRIFGMAVENTIKVEISFSPVDLPSGRWERSKISQILLNLLRNAKEAILETQLSQGRIDIWIDPPDISQKVQIHVKDNGIGIPPENLSKVFNYGFTTKSHGHGLGLHSCINLAREMGGDLKVKSDGIGKGAEFILILPYNPSSH